MTLLDAMQKVVDDSQKLATTCRACGIKDTAVCQARECETYPDVIAQLIIVRDLTKKGLLKKK